MVLERLQRQTNPDGYDRGTAQTNIKRVFAAGDAHRWARVRSREVVLCRGIRVSTCSWIPSLLLIFCTYDMAEHHEKVPKGGPSTDIKCW